MIGNPVFRHDDRSVPEEAWCAAGLDRLPAVSLSGIERLIVVAAHPDDETLGAGGVINVAARLNLTVTVVVATDGSASHPASPTFGPAQLAELRKAEVRAAVADLAPKATVKFLELPDGQLADHVGALVASLDGVVTPQPTLLVAPWRGDGHPDHRAAGEAAQEIMKHHAALRVWEYPIWWWHWGDPTRLVPGLATMALDESTRAAKRAAMGQHLSQTEPLSDRPGDEVLLSTDFLTHFDRPFETFVVSPNPQDVADSPDTGSLPAAFFDEFYGDEPDPWGFASRWYEERKRAITLACLPRARFRRLFEPGCSIGVLTAELAGRCDSLLATDISEIPLRTARRRLAGAPHVEFQTMAIPREWPTGKFDCIILSEIGYYLGEDDLAQLLERLPGALEPGGILLACHWRHPVAEYPGDAEHVHAELNKIDALHRLVRHEEADFRLEVWSTDDQSVAGREGLA